MQRFILTSLFVCLASVVSAQTPTGWVIKIYQPGGTVVVSTTLIPLAPGGFVCNQPQTTTVVTVNPNKIVVNDPTNVADVACIYTDPGTGPLLSLPAGNYEAGVAATNTIGTTLEFLPHPLFTRTALVLPGVPTGVRIVR